MHITFQKFYDLQYITMRISVYMKSPTELEFLALCHGMEYIMYHPHEPIMYLRKYIFKANKISLNFFFKSVKDETKQTQQYSKQFHTYCDA